MPGALLAAKRAAVHKPSLAPTLRVGVGYRTGQTTATNVCRRHQVLLCQIRPSFRSYDYCSFRASFTTFHSKKARAGGLYVRSGRVPGEYQSWEEAHAQVNGYPGAKFKRFANRDAGLAYLRGEVYKGPRSTPKLLIAYGDGSARGQSAGIGIHWADEPGAKDLSERVPCQDQTNNRAELYALLRILETDPDPQRAMVMYLDSRFVINTFEPYLPDWPKRCKPGAKHEHLINLIHYRLNQRPGMFQFIKVAAHSGDYGNELVDELAARATALPKVPTRDFYAELRALQAAEGVSPQ